MSASEGPAGDQLIAACRRARAAANALALLGRAEKDAALAEIAAALVDGAGEVIAANAEDVAEARAAKMSDALLDRLALDEKRLRAIADGVREMIALDDPVGEVVGMRRRPNGLLVGQQRIPLGVIAMIYESRPNVTIDAAALGVKSGNAVILRGGKEARRSNQALGELARRALGRAGLPADAVQIVSPEGHVQIRELASLAGQIDLLIPRGGEALIRSVVEHARVPVVQHFKGVCHLFVDEDADLAMALRLIDNGKLSRPGVCNALECLLVHDKTAPALLPRLSELCARGLEVRGDDATVALLPVARRAAPSDYGEEFLAPILAVRVVASFDEAVDHVRRFGSRHTEAICTNSYERAQRFLREVDASCVLVNASTRFNDGGMLGLGAEIGISTTKLHAYGPMGLSSLTALKWIVQGSGQLR